MDDHRKAAYRFLLYHAMLDIRRCGRMRPSVRGMWNPFARRHGSLLTALRQAGVVADWLHNLAFFSAVAFADFEEDWFWRDLAQVEVRYPELGLGRYRNWFDQQMSGTSAGLLAPPPA